MNENEPRDEDSREIEIGGNVCVRSFTFTFYMVCVFSQLNSVDVQTTIILNFSNASSYCMML